MTFSESANILATFFTKYSFFLKMESFTYIYKQGGALRNRPGSPYNRTEAVGRVWLHGKTAGVPCRRRASPRYPSHPARNRPLRRITLPAPAGTNACSVPVKYWKRRGRLCCVLFGHSGRSTPQTANSGAGGRTHRAPRPGIGPFHGEETENSRRSGGNGCNGAPKAAEASSASETA